MQSLELHKVNAASIVPQEYFLASLTAQRSLTAFLFTKKLHRVTTEPHMQSLELHKVNAARECWRSLTAFLSNICFADIKPYLTFYHIIYFFATPNLLLVNFGDLCYNILS